MRETGCGAKILLAFFAARATIKIIKQRHDLQGRVQFPIGGKVRERFGAGFGVIPKPTV